MRPFVLVINQVSKVTSHLMQSTVVAARVRLCNSFTNWKVLGMAHSLHTTMKHCLSAAASMTESLESDLHCNIVVRRLFVSPEGLC